MFSLNKNSYLQSKYCGVDAGIINRCVQNARDFPCIDEHDLSPPFNRLTSAQPCIPVENLDPTRRPVAFGTWAMPKLRRELHHKDPLVVLAAITSISDLVHDPERGYEAIRLRIPDRIADLLLDKCAAVRERACLALRNIAGLADGKEAIVANEGLLLNIAKCLQDQECHVRHKAALLLETIATFWKAADTLVESGFIPLIISKLLKEEPETTEVLLRTLYCLMYCEGKKIAIEFHVSSILRLLLERQETGILAGAASCVAEITSTKMGRKLAFENNSLSVLNRLLHDERPEVYTEAAHAIMYCTVTTKGKIGAAKIPGLAKRLVQICKNRLNPSTQIYAIKTLTNICEHPEIRKEVKTELFKDIKEIQLGAEPCLNQYKKSLVMIIGWLPEEIT